ncbi:MAG: hypothetical protein ACKO7B_04610, partial [Flavobacteriales bacterium]
MGSGDAAFVDNNYRRVGNDGVENYGARVNIYDPSSSFLRGRGDGARGLQIVIRFQYAKNGLSSPPIPLFPTGRAPISP